MNEDKLNSLRQHDANLREAIRLDEMERPHMPADLNARLMQKMGKQSQASRVRKFWPWIAAACVAAFIAVYITPPKDTINSGVDIQKVTAKVEQPNKSQPSEPKAKEPQTNDVNEVTTSPTPVAKPKLHKSVTVEKFVAQQSAPAEIVQQAAIETDLATTTAQPVKEKITTLTERDIPITRPENYKYTPEELAQLKKQAAEAYLKWVELEMEISKNNLQQTAQVKD